MNSGKKIKNNIYFIEWQDAHSSSEWLTKKEVEEFINEEKCIVQQVGWILSETNDEIVIGCRTLKYKYEQDADDTRWGMVQKIPKAWIKKRIILKCLTNVKD